MSIPNVCCKALVFLLALVFSISEARGVFTTNLQRGCLYSKQLSSKMRVCNSEDPPEAAGVHCRVPSLVAYDEVRIAPGNWDSSNLESWLLQILLSEILDVPTSTEMRSPETPSNNLYNPDRPFAFPDLSDGYAPFENAFVRNGDCSKADQSIETYESCAHIFPEAWEALGSNQALKDAIDEGYLETPNTLGLLGQTSWFIPKFTAEKDPSLRDYTGYQGQENRETLAELFKRPLTWRQYCEEVSTHNCSYPDRVAQRAPMVDTDRDEPNRMFVEDLYTGHFISTDKNNCTLNPDDCSGLFVNFPCFWTSYVPAALHHLDIGLDVDLEVQYSLSQMEEIWKAANATRSDVIMIWWSPNRLYSKFLGTEAEFVQVTLPLATVDCMEARNQTAFDHCSLEEDVRIGSKESVCMDPPMLLTKLISPTIFETSQHQNIPDGIESPSQAALSNFRFNSLQLGEVFELWESVGDPRDAVCNWVSDNLDYLRDLVPRTYPRIFETQDHGALMYASTIVGAAVMVMVLLTMCLVYENRDRRRIKYSQVEFLGLLLIGSFSVALGAILMGVPPTSGSCIAQVWFINVGISMSLVPLIVKVAAVNRIMTIGKKMRRAKIDRNFLFGIVATICLGVVIFLLLWTLLDPPKVTAEYTLTTTTNDQEETVVWVFDVCGSQSNAWTVVSVGWNALLLVCTLTLAVQMRKVDMEGFCETGTLGLLVYSHSFFIILQVITYILSGVVKDYILTHCQSFIFSVDTLATIVIYFLPKIFAKDIESSKTTISAQSLNQFSGHSLPSARPSDASATPWMVKHFQPSASMHDSTRHRLSGGSVPTAQTQPAAQEPPNPTNPPALQRAPSGLQRLRSSMQRTPSGLQRIRSGIQRTRSSWIVLEGVEEGPDLDDLESFAEDTDTEDLKGRLVQQEQKIQVLEKEIEFLKSRKQDTAPEGRNWPERRRAVCEKEQINGQDLPVQMADEDPTELSKCSE